MSKVSENQICPFSFHCWRPVSWLLACLLLMPSPLLGACSSSTLSALDFGNYDIFGTTPLDSTGATGFRCAQSDHNITISLDTGGASSLGKRRMLKGTETIFYNLYLDAARTVIWGDGSGGSQTYFI